MRTGLVCPSCAEMYKDHPAIFGLQPLNEPWQYTPIGPLKRYYFEGCARTPPRGRRQRRLARGAHGGRPPHVPSALHARARLRRYKAVKRRAPKWKYVLSDSFRPVIDIWAPFMTGW